MLPYHGHGHPVFSVHAVLQTAAACHLGPDSPALHSTRTHLRGSEGVMGVGIAM